jgi:tRNA pseudouridine55 synthase
MSNKVINVYKKCGETPLECINILKNANYELKFLPMTYAGRLDPLAEGVLLILMGDECLKKDEYLNLSKEYEVDILFGFETDTYDVMGKVLKGEITPMDKFLGLRIWKMEAVPDHKNWSTNFDLNSEIIDNNFISKIQKIIPQFTGKIKQSYPSYSSRTVKGKPLFEWARNGKLNEIEIPVHDVFVESIEVIEDKKISGEDLLKKINECISKVKGDFRQKDILSLWNIELKNKYKEEYFVVRLKISCGSGVYVRVLANDIGKKLGIPALALKIIRTKVGKYTIN